jgi:hypothetical protein
MTISKHYLVARNCSISLASRIASLGILCTTAGLTACTSRNMLIWPQYNIISPACSMVSTLMTDSTSLLHIARM